MYVLSLVKVFKNICVNCNCCDWLDDGFVGVCCYCCFNNLVEDYFVVKC